MTNRHAVARGAVVGLLLFVPISALRVLVDRSVNDFDHSGWAPVFAVAFLLVYPVVGVVAGRLAADAPVVTGLTAALGAFVAWIPVRVLIWLVRDTSQGLVSGDSPVFRPGEVAVQLALAAALGALGGWLASRRPTAITLDD